MTSQEIERRTPQQELMARLEGDNFQKALVALLPENVTPERFRRVFGTALMANPEIVEAEPTTIMQSLLRIAEMGLLPNGREAAIVVRKNSKKGIKEAQGQAMIDGVRRRFADHGWTLRTQVVYANDEFEYDLTPPERVIRHVRVRPGGERGNLIHAYAVATHRDGRRETKVIGLEEIETAMAASRFTGPGSTWDVHTAAMWEKTAGHRIAKQVGLADDDRVVAMFAPPANGAEAAALMYGPDARAALASGETVDRSTGEVLPASGGSADTGERPAVAPTTQQAEASAPSAGDAAAAPTPSPSDASAPEPDDEPSLFNEQETPGSFVVPDAEGIGESWRGKTLAEIAALEQTDDKTGERLGEKWFAYVAKNPSKYPPELYAALQHFRPQLFDAKAS